MFALLKDTSNQNIKRSAIWKIEREDFIKIVLSKNTYSEILSHFGLKLHGGNNHTLKKRIQEEGIDISHLIEGRKRLNKEHLNSIHNKRRKSFEEILTINSSYNRDKLKKRLIKEGLLEEKCYSCGLGSTWLNKPLTLQLEHKNGINDDNRLENLCLLCPNCHSQTETFAGKSLKKYYYCKNTKCKKAISRFSKSGYCKECSNKFDQIYSQRKVLNRPNRIELINLILNKTFVQIGLDYGVTDNAVRKWCIYENLPSKSKDIILNRKDLELELMNNKIS